MDRIDQTREDTVTKIEEKKKERKNLTNTIRKNTFKNEGLLAQRKFIHENVIFIIKQHIV